MSESNPTPLLPTTPHVQFTLSADQWVTAALGAEKVTGPEGFESFCSYAGWQHHLHYSLIDERRPEWSPLEALPEMQDMLDTLVSELHTLAQAIDEGLMRHQKMVEQIAAVKNNHINNHHHATI